MDSSNKVLTNVLLFNACWFTSAYGVRANLPWLGPILVSISLLIHCYFVVGSVKELIFIMTGGLMGYGIDTILHQLGILKFFSMGVIPSIPPLWLLFVWFIFFSLIHVSIRWMRNYLLIASVSGALVGPLSYLAADAIGTLSLARPIKTTMPILAVVWAIIMPLFLWISSMKPFDVSLTTTS